VSFAYVFLTIPYLSSYTFVTTLCLCLFTLHSSGIKTVTHTFTHSCLPTHTITNTCFQPRQPQVSKRALLRVELLHWKQFGLCCVWVIYEVSVCVSGWRREEAEWKPKRSWHHKCQQLRVLMPLCILSWHVADGNQGNENTLLSHLI